MLFSSYLSVNSWIFNILGTISWTRQFFMPSIFEKYKWFINKLVMLLFNCRQLECLNYTTIGHLNHVQMITTPSCFDIWGMWSHAHASWHARNIGDVKKKACLVWLRKMQDVRQITHLKQQRSLSFTFCETQRSYEKIMCVYLLFHWFSGENCIIRSSDQTCYI